jgi:amino acid transporter
VTRAVLVSPVVVGVLFVFAACAALTGHGTVVVDAYYGGTRSGGPPWMVPALDVGMACSWLACTLGCAQAGSRLLYSMGVEHVVPGLLSRVHARLRTPYAAVAVFMATGLVGAGVYGPAGRHDVGMFNSVVETALVVAYTLVAYASLRFLRRIGEHTVPTLVAGGVVSALGAGLLAVIAAEGALHGEWAAPVALVLLASSGALWHAVLRRVRPASLTQIGAFDSVETADILPGAGVLVLDAQGRRRIVAGPAGDCREERAG